MTFDYRKLFVALIAAVVIAVPTAMVFQNHTKQLESERQQKSRLQLDIKKKDSELEKFKVESSDKLKEKSEEADKLKKQNEQLKKQLQAKAEAKKKAATLASVQRTTVTSTVAGNCESYRGMVAKYNWDVSTMMRIMNAESSCTPTKNNWTDHHATCDGSYGLFQIGCIHGYTWQSMQSPSANIAAAYKIYLAQGYTAWSTY